MGEILRKLHGVEAVRIIERGVWISFQPKLTHADKICTALREGGYEPDIFQDSETGETNEVKF